jgi:hypothetical protein
MFKFFRKTREKLLNQGKTAKYLQYAIGEIMLVVIGILIALQINTWNNNRVELQQEQLILKSLKSNLQDSLKDLHKEYALTISQYEDTLRLAELVHPKGDFDFDEVDRLLASVLNPSSFDPATGVMDEIINSGHLDLIKNKHLKDKISNWSRIYEDAEEDVVYSLNYVFNNLVPYLGDKANFINLPAPIYLLKNNNLRTPPKSSFKADYKTFMTSLEFENLLSMHSLNLTFLLYEYKSYQTYFETTIELLESEINSNL